MINKTRFLMVSIFVLIAAAMLASCGPPGTAAVSEDDIRILAENKMQAINEGDYTIFCQDFSDQLREAFTEEKFIEFREKVLDASGRFESITSSRISSTQNKDYVAYVYSTKFENENVTLTLVYAIDGDQVEGIFFNAPKLNRALQAQQ